MNWLKRWLQNEENRAKRTAGLKEKEEGIKMKMEVALSILGDKRKRSIPIKNERRVSVHPA